MTNYMGKRRLEKILLQMLSDRPELQELVKTERDFIQYRTYRGDEWLKIWLGEYEFRIYATGKIAKVISFEEYHSDTYSDVMSQYNRVLTKYNGDFKPLPLATWLSGGCELRKRGYFPFQPERNDPAYNADEAAKLKPDAFMCYDIAKCSKPKNKEEAR